jgi:hypothetical protein
MQNNNNSWQERYAREEDSEDSNNVFWAVGSEEMEVESDEMGNEEEDEDEEVLWGPETGDQGKIINLTTCLNTRIQKI